VTDEFGLTRENCPGHTAFMRLEELVSNKANGLVCFGLFVEAKQVGFIGVEIDEDGGDGRFWLEKLAVVPSERHKGFGERLINRAIRHAMRHGGVIVRLGMMDEHTELKSWYKRLGFREASKRRFDHLPFTVCFMDKKLKASPR
jgi:diamine N-acetyltransferase